MSQTTIMSLLLRRIKRLASFTLCSSGMSIAIGMVLLYRYIITTERYQHHQCLYNCLREESNVTLVEANQFIIPSPFLWRKDNKKHFLSTTNLEGKFVEYSVARMGLQSLDQIPSLDPSLGMVVNDVLSFQYYLNINKNLLAQSCLKWTEGPLNNSTETTLLVVVVSAVGHFERRSLIRKTWATWGDEQKNWVQVVFLVGLSSASDETQRLVNESSLHGDLVQVNVIDSYSNLTLKSVALLHWTHTHCQSAKWILKCDDDLYVNFHFLRDTITLRLPNGSDKLYGSGVKADSPKRSKANKYFISRIVWPWPKYPDFVNGGGYIFNGKNVAKLLAAAQTTPFFPLEDIYITGICAKRVNITIVSSKEYYEPFIPRKLDACFCRKTAMWQTQSEKQFINSHETVVSVYKNNTPCRLTCHFFKIC